MSTKVFICYSSIDEHFAKKLAQKLEEISIKYFLDRRDIGWGSSITEEIRKGLTECAAVVVVISPASLKSQWVAFEIGHAISAGKKILPFLIHPSLDIPDFLRDLRHVTRLEDAEKFFRHLLEPSPETGEEEIKATRKVLPKEGDKVRAERNLVTQKSVSFMGLASNTNAIGRSYTIDGMLYFGLSICDKDILLVLAMITKYRPKNAEYLKRLLKPFNLKEERINEILAILAISGAIWIGHPYDAKVTDPNLAPIDIRKDILEELQKFFRANWPVLFKSYKGIEEDFDKPRNI